MTYVIVTTRPFPWRRVGPVGDLLLGAAFLDASIALAPSVGDIVFGVALSLATSGLFLGVGLAPLFS